MTSSTLNLLNSTLSTLENQISSYRHKSKYTLVSHHKMNEKVSGYNVKMTQFAQTKDDKHVTMEDDNFAINISHLFASEEDREVLPVMRKVLKLAGVGNGDIVVDVGGGTGAAINYVRDVVGNDGYLILLDISPSMVKYTKNKIKKYNFHNVDVGQNSHGSLCLKQEELKGKINCFIVLDVYHHFEKKNQILTEMYNFLAPGGILLIIEYTHGALKEMHNKLTQGKWKHLFQKKFHSHGHSHHHDHGENHSEEHKEDSHSHEHGHDNNHHHHHHDSPHFDTKEQSMEYSKKSCVKECTENKFKFKKWIMDGEFEYHFIGVFTKE